MRLLHLSFDPIAHGELDEAGLSDLYRHPAVEGRRAWVRSNFVSSLDGSIQGADGHSGSINTESDHHVFALHRAHADAILVGAQTVRSEGYRAVDLDPWQRRLRTVEGLSDFPLLAVVTRSLDLDPGIAANGALPVGDVMILTTDGKTAEQLEPFTTAGIDVVQLGSGGVDLGAAVRHLAAADYPRILCEGGARLHHDLLAADLLDEMSLTMAPVVVGGEGHRTTVGGPLPDQPAFRLGSALYAEDGALFLNYLRAR